MTLNSGNLGDVFRAHADGGRLAIIDLSDPDAPREIRFAALDAGCDALARGLVSVGESQVTAEIDIAELAAWTAVTSVILSSDEFMTRN